MISYFENAFFKIWFYHILLNLALKFSKIRRMREISKKINTILKNLIALLQNILKTIKFLFKTFFLFFIVSMIFTQKYKNRCFSRRYFISLVISIQIKNIYFLFWSKLQYIQSSSKSEGNSSNISLLVRRFTEIFLSYP